MTKQITVAVLVLSLAWACDSARPPTSPAPTTPPVPIPPPAPPLPVDAANMINLPAPAAPPSSATDPIVGRYTLEIVAPSSSDVSCAAVPAHARRRIYTADIQPFRDYYAVHLYDATFLRDRPSIGYGCFDTRLEMGGVCHQFIMKRETNSMLSLVITPEDEWRGSEIWEVLVEDARLLQISGNATGTVNGGRISATGRGSFWYGNGLPASDVSACGPGDIALTFTRR